MSTTPKVTSEKILLFEDPNTALSKKSSIITTPIELKHISNTLTNNLTMSSVVKAGLVFLGTIGGYYLIKTTRIFSYFESKRKNSKDVVSRKLMKTKNTKKSLSIKRNLKTTKQVNNPSKNWFVQMAKNDHKIAEFEEINVEEFKDLSKEKKENEIKLRSISIKNPIPNQNVVFGKLFNLTIDGINVFSSNSSLFLEATYTPTWLISSNPNPTFKSSYDTPDSALEVAISSNYAYVGACDDNSSLQIIDISDPANPTFKSSYNTSFVQGIAISLNYAYVAVYYDAGLQIIDISDPSNPTFKGSYNALSYPQNIVVFENYAYIADYDSGLQIIDISNPENPTFKGSYDTPGLAYDVAVFENYAYIADNWSGLQIIDISDPSNPTFKCSYNTPGAALAVTLYGNYAYVADGKSGLQIIDISDPSNPTFKGSYYMSHTSKAALSENYAYVVDYWSRLLRIIQQFPKNL
jgi:hypothetical protein